MDKKNITVCYVLSYNPKYVRTRFLLAALAEIKNVQIVTAISSRKVPARYFLTIAKVLWVRVTKRPDFYLLGFRGYEVYWPVRIITAGKPLIFDEFINASMWVGEENNKLKVGGLAHTFLKYFAAGEIKTADAVLSDTQAHADYSAAEYGVSSDLFTPVYVGTDETVFKNSVHKKLKTGRFEVFFYGTIVPLHGIDVILDAFSMLPKDKFHLTFVGSSKNSERQEHLEKRINTFSDDCITYKKWVPFDELPDYIQSADVCLGGPFGNTTQSNLVITGKTYQFVRSGKATIIGRIKDMPGFENRVNCLLVKQGSPKELMDILLWAEQNQHKLETIGKNGAQLYDEKFSVKAQLPVLEGLLRKLS